MNLKSNKMKSRSILQYVILASAGAALFAGCAQEEIVPAGGGRTPVRFHGSVQAVLPQEAVHGGQTQTISDMNDRTTWKVGDQVGIIMVKAGGSMPDDILLNAANVPYKVDDTAGTLSPADGTPIYYPNTGDAVDFFAYYPFDPLTGQEDYLLQTGPLSDQTTAERQERFDLLYSHNAVNVPRSKSAVSLSFSHLMSKLTFEIKLDKKLAGGEISEVLLSGMPAHATFNLRDGTLSGTEMSAGDEPISALRSAEPASGTDAVYTVLVSPQDAEAFIGRKITILVNGVEYEGAIPDGDIYRSNTRYIYPVTVQRAGVRIGSMQIGDWKINDRGSDDATEVGRSISKVRIPAGTFLMGSSDGSNIGDKDKTGLNTTPVPGNISRLDDETQHWVTISHDFHMSQFEITNSQFAQFLNAIKVGSDGKFSRDDYPDGLYPNETLIQDSDVKPQPYAWGVTWNGTIWKPCWGYDNFPVIYVSWYGAMEFAHWIGGSLPTEAQWEYACRAGTTTPFYFGSDIAELSNHAWFNGSDKKTRPVGQKLPNPYGLYDMYGNVWEWCLDWYGNYGSEHAIDPVGPASGSYRVRRGCGWLNVAYYIHSAHRSTDQSIPSRTNFNIGFRVVFN